MMGHWAGKLINSMNIKTRFIVLSMLLLTLATTAVVVIRAYQINYQTRALISERLQSNANLAIGIFGTVRIYTDWILEAVANMPYVREALTNAHGPDVNLGEHLAVFFSGMSLTRDSVYAVHAYANIFVFDSSFRVVAAAYPEGDMVDLSDGVFLHNTIMAQLGHSRISPVVKNPRSGLLQFLFTRPVKVNGTFSGMVAILFNTEVLDFFLRDPTHHYDSFINIADRSGTIFFSNRPAYMGRHLNDLGVYEAFGYVPLNVMFAHNSAITGIDKIAYISTEPQLDWTVVSFFDADAVESIAWAIFISLLPTVIGIVLTAASMVIIFHRSLTPLNALTNTAKNVARGNLEVTFDIHRKDEISQVSQSFLEIVTALNILKDNFRNAESAMTSSGTIYMLEDSRLGGIYGEMLAMTNNVIKHIQQSKLDAENASKAKSDFLSKMSHEIRTPMNAIMGMTELILREDISAAAREQAVTIKQSGYHLLSIINDILDLSKVESGKLELINTEYLFHSTVHDVISIMKMRMTNPELRFAVYMQHDIPNELFGDEVRIRQILLNVLTNALKYTKTGFFSLDITGSLVDEDTILLTMKIKDSGIGIKPEDMGKLFSEFAQFDLEKNRNVEGSGLGLVITRNLINLMGGEIEVYSEYGKGSEFIILLPQKLYNKDPEAAYSFSPSRFEDKRVLLYGRTPIYTEYTARAFDDLKVGYHIVHDVSELYNKLLEGTWGYIFAEDEFASTAMHIVYSCELDTKVVLMSDAYVPKGGQDFSILIMPAYFLSIATIFSGGDLVTSAESQQKEHFVAPDAKVLLVDDINTNLKVGEGLLNSYGMTITSCTSGREAIEAVKTADYDLVLMDHMMPEMDGVEAVKHIRELAGEKYTALPIVALTANAIVGAKEMFLQNGFDDFLPKPIETVKLHSILAKWIPKEKQKAALAINRSSTPEEDLPVIIRIEDVDAARGILFSGGSARNYLDILKVFHKDGIKKTAELTGCLENNNLPLYTTYIHAMKSASANIGADKLSEAARVLEAAGMKNDMDFIKEHNGVFLDNLKKLLADIDQTISANAEKPDSKPLDNNVMKDQLAKLKSALENFDVAAIDEASFQLQAFTQLPETGEILSEILQNAFVGKYKQAAAQIDQLMERCT